jgi:hypothetical protein
MAKVISLCTRKFVRLIALGVGLALDRRLFHD